MSDRKHAAATPPAPPPPRNPAGHMCPRAIRHLNDCCAADLLAERDALRAALSEANAINDELRGAVRTMQETINGRWVKGVRHAD